MPDRVDPHTPAATPGYSVLPRVPSAHISRCALRFRARSHLRKTKKSAAVREAEEGVVDQWELVAQLEQVFQVRRAASIPVLPVPAALKLFRSPREAISSHPQRRTVLQWVWAVPQQLRHKQCLPTAVWRSLYKL